MHSEKLKSKILNNKFLISKVAATIIITVKIMILSRYRYRPVTVPLPSRYHFLQALPIVHHRDTIVPHRS
jgi:hypothetical protein